MSSTGPVDVLDYDVLGGGGSVMSASYISQVQQSQIQTQIQTQSQLNQSIATSEFTGDGHRQININEGSITTGTGATATACNGAGIGGKGAGAAGGYSFKPFVGQKLSKSGYVEISVCGEGGEGCTHQILYLSTK